MNFQEIIVGIVILVCIVWIVRRTILCFKRIKHGGNPCEGCPCGCNTHGEKCPNEKKIAISSKFFIETLADSKNSRTFATAIEKQTMQAKKMKTWFLG